MLIRGPFSIRFGENQILDVSEVGFNYDVATNDYETIDGRNYTIDGTITASIDITLLSTDVDALSVVLPQYYVPAGDPMSTGETAPEGGAIDIVAASCDTINTNRNLDIISCTGDVTRLVNARTSLSTVDIADNSLRTVTITFRGEPAQNKDGTTQGIIQFFKPASES